MSLKAVLENLEGVDAVFHEHYTEKQETVDGKPVTRWYLEIEDDIRRHPKGKTLQAALDRIKTEKAALVTKLEEAEAKVAELPDDFDAEQFAKDMDELTELRKKIKEKGGGEGNDDDESKAQSLKKLYDQRIATMEKKHGEEKVKLENEKRELEAELERLVADEGLIKHLHAAGVDKKLMPGATALLRRSVKVRKEDDGHRRAFVETQDGEVPIEEFISSWSQSDEGAVYLEKPKGGGAPGGDGQKFIDNPWINDPKTGRKPNLYKQQEIMKANSAKAKQMMQAAGLPQSEIDRVFQQVA